MGCLSKGASGSGVAEIIVALQQVGLFSTTAILADAVYDDTVAQAVSSYQSYHGITVDGVVGPQTAALMGVDPAFLTGRCPTGSSTSPVDQSDLPSQFPPITITGRAPSSSSKGSSSSLLFALLALGAAFKFAS